MEEIFNFMKSYSNFKVQTKVSKVQSYVYEIV